MKPFTPCADAERAVFTPEELERIEFMRANAVLLDPDGYDTIEEIRAALKQQAFEDSCADPCYCGRPGEYCKCP